MTMFCEDHMPRDARTTDYTENPFAQCARCGASPGDGVESLTVVGGES